jgi:DNA-binding MarR family transcriptional regulator
MLALLHIAANPGATNREVALAAGIASDSQVSRVLSRLHQLGLAVNRPPEDRAGVANAWHLTAAGRRAAREAGAQAHGLRAAVDELPEGA